MIDPADKQTQTLPLEPQKRGRGRPSTGQAMTPAQKQKAYRERQKGNVTKNRVDDLSENIQLRDQLLAAMERIAELEEESKKNRRTIVEQARMIQEAKELGSRDEKTFWDVESRPKGKRTWSIIGAEGEPFGSRKTAEEFAERLRTDKSAMADGWKYRVVQAKAPK